MHRFLESGLRRKNMRHLYVLSHGMEEVTEKILTIHWKRREWGNELEPGAVFEKSYKILVK